MASPDDDEKNPFLSPAHIYLTLVAVSKPSKIGAGTKIYSTQREGEGTKATAQVMAEVKIFENKREAEVAEVDAEIAMRKAKWPSQAVVAEVEATKAIAIQDELQLEVERRKALRETEKLKAERLSKAIVDYEMKVQEANWELYKRQKQAEGLLFEQERLAEGKRAAAEAVRYAREQEAETELYAKKMEAEGMAFLERAQKLYLSSLMKTLGGNDGTLRDYLMINGGIYQDMARLNAVCGLNPKISIWNNGSTGDAAAADGVGGGVMKEVAGVYKMLPPPASGRAGKLTGSGGRAREPAPAWQRR